MKTTKQTESPGDLQNTATMGQDDNYLLLKTEYKRFDLLIADSYFELVENYYQHLSKTISNPNQIKQRLRIVTKFTNSLYQNGCKDISDLSPSMIYDQYNNCSSSKFWFTCSIRHFLSYLKCIEAIDADFTKIVPAYHRGKTYPSVYSKDDISKLINTFDLKNDDEIRDYLMFYFSYELALRSVDIVNLKEDDFDYKAKRLSLIQQKTEIPVSFTVDEDVIKLIKQQFENNRMLNEKNRFLFISKRTPYNRVCKDVVYRTINSRIKAAGIDTTNKKMGAHSLRASKATHLLENDIPLPIITKYLGHSSVTSTTHYLKADIEKLRNCSLEVPLMIGGMNNGL